MKASKDASAVGSQALYRRTQILRLFTHLEPSEVQKTPDAASTDMLETYLRPSTTIKKTSNQACP